MTQKYHSLINFLEVKIKPQLNDKWYGEIYRFTYGKGWTLTHTTELTDTTEYAFMLIHRQLKQLLKEEFDNGR